MADASLWQKDEELKAVFSLLETLGVRPFVSYDPSVVRGLDYYTGVVFEARDVSGEFRAILGGGRYDNLVADVGGEALTGMGFAMGDMVLEEVPEIRKFPTVRPGSARVLVAQFAPESAWRRSRYGEAARAGVPCALPEAAKRQAAQVRRRSGSRGDLGLTRRNQPSRSRFCEARQKTVTLEEAIQN